MASGRVPKMNKTRINFEYNRASCPLIDVIFITVAVRLPFADLEQLGSRALMLNSQSVMRSSLNFHEDLKRSADVRGSSDRKFGLVFAVFFLLVGLWPLHRGAGIRIPALAAAGVFLAVSLFQPALLGPLNWAWTKLGLLLGRIVNPIATAVLFYLVFTPAGLLSRLRGTDSLHLKLEPGADTYWIPRNPPGPQPGTMSKQF